MDDATKAIFAAAAERRKQRGIKLKRIGLMAEAGQVEVFHMIYSGWVERFGKEDAVDFLVSMMCEAETKLREWDASRRRDKKKKRVR
jgi:hypothetical protein